MTKISKPKAGVVKSSPAGKGGRPAFIQTAPGQGKSSPKSKSAGGRRPAFGKGAPGVKSNPGA